MKTRALVTLLLIAIVLVSCTPATMLVPSTETAIPTATLTPVPLTPTITPTLTPENLADAKDLSKWVEGYVHAFGGKITVNEVDMDTSQLTDAIRKNSEAFIRVKEIAGMEYLFLLINDVPLAMREGKGQWEELTSRKMIDLGAKPDDVFKYFGVQFSNPFNLNKSAEIDELLGKEFNSAFLNDGYWHVVEQREGHPDFTDVVDAAKEARQKGMFVIGGQLVDPRGEFEYTYLKNRKDISRDELASIMVEHIKMQMEALKGNVDAYVVVNESRAANETTDEGTYADPFNSIIGEDYIETAFQTARDTDPNVVLIYNDGDNYHPAYDYTNGSNNTPRTLEVVDRLRTKGLIDGVGIQMHIFASEPPNMDKMVKTIKAYGVPVYVTELEINIDNVGGSDSEKAQIRTDLYRKILTTILENNLAVAVSHWTSVSDDSGHTGQLFDDQLNPTVNLFVERQVLFEYLLGN
jgi:GH35 family endo-1,4-beta-xylanase